MFKLVLDDVPMANLAVTVSEIPGGHELILTFYLIRKSQDDDNQKAGIPFLENSMGNMN